MTIHTTKICHHPYLKLPTYQKPVPITCNPAVSEEVYQGYLKEEEGTAVLNEIVIKKISLVVHLYVSCKIFQTIEILCLQIIWKFCMNVAFSVFWMYPSLDKLWEGEGGIRLFSVRTGLVLMYVFFYDTTPAVL